MSQYDRKWDGIPHTEQKRLPPPDNMPKDFGPRRSHKTSSEIFRISQLSWGGFFDKTLSPHIGVPVTTWNIYSACDFVVKRLKALIIRDKDARYLYIITQGTKEQISPEFASQDGIVNWLIYRGFEEGWLSVSSSTWWGETHHRIVKKDSF